MTITEGAVVVECVVVVVDVEEEEEEGLAKEEAAVDDEEEENDAAPAHRAGSVRRGDHLLLTVPDWPAAPILLRHLPGGVNPDDVEARIIDGGEGERIDISADSHPGPAHAQGHAAAQPGPKIGAGGVMGPPQERGLHGLVLSLEAEERGNAVRNSAEAARWHAQIVNRIQRAWIRPPSAQPGIECIVSVTQVPGGEVTSVKVNSCNGGDAALRESVEAAVLRASPLPSPPDPALFERSLELTFAPTS